MRLGDDIDDGFIVKRNTLFVNNDTSWWNSKASIRKRKTFCLPLQPHSPDGPRCRELFKRAAKLNELDGVKGTGCGKMSLCNPRARRMALEASGIPADAEVRR
jgi:hypothetical protein